MLKPDLRPWMINLWTEMYNRFDDGIHPRESLYDLGKAYNCHAQVLEDITELDCGHCSLSY